MFNIKRRFVAFALCAGLLSQPVSIKGECDSFTKAVDPIGCLIYDLMSMAIAISVAAPVMGTLYFAAKSEIILVNKLFGVNIPWKESAEEEVSPAVLLPAIVVPIAGLFALNSTKNFLKSMFAGDSRGVLRNAGIIGASGLASLAAGFAVNDEFVRSFIEENLVSMGMIGGMAVAVGLVVSKITNIVENQNAALNKNKVVALNSNSKLLNTSFDMQGDVYNQSEMMQDITRVINETLPAAIEQKITALINKEVDGIEFFPTPKQKIWALQNIEDFLVFPYGLEEKGSEKEKEAKNLNPYIYRVIMKKIRELQSQLMVAVDENDNEIWADNDENNRAIDDLCEQYRKDFTISVTRLRSMKQNVLDQKIRDVAAALNKIKDRKNADNEKRAMISILYHLLYKKINQKQAVLIEKSLKDAQAQVAAKSHYVEKVKAQFPEGTVIDTIEKPTSSGFANWFRERFFAKKQPQVVDIGVVRSMQKVEPKPVKQRGIISRWWNRWFGTGE